MIDPSVLFAVETAHDPDCKRPLRLPSDIAVPADFGGPNNCYRYKLKHRWGLGERVLFLLNNPSAASEEFTDATVAKCGRLARRWGYGGLMIGNTCAYRATDQRRLLILVAHGQLPGELQKHADAMVDLLCPFHLYVLRLSSSGVPMHPLARGRNYIPEDVRPSLWSRSTG